MDATSMETRETINMVGRDAQYERTIQEVALMLKVIRKKYEKRGIRFDNLKRVSCPHCSGLGYTLK